MLKRIFASVLLLAFSAAIVGCEASAQVGDPDYDNDGTSTYKKTTTVKEPDGDVKTKTETKIDR